MTIQLSLSGTLCLVSGGSYRCSADPTQAHPTSHPRNHRTPSTSFTSFLSWRHSSTDRLLLKVCLAQSRVTSSLHTASSANFQPVERLRGGEAAKPTFFSATAAFPGARPGPPFGFCGLSISAATLAAMLFSPRIRYTNDKMHIKNRGRGTRIQSAIFTALFSLMMMYSRTLGKIKSR